MVDDDDPTDVRAEIWKLFGKDRDRYVGQDVCSDDEDMEADVLDVEKEEMKRCASFFVTLTTVLPIRVHWM